MVNWTIKRANGVTHTLTELGIGKPTRTLVNQSVDQCVFPLVNAVMKSDSVAWADLEFVTVLRDGTPWFSGNVLPPDRDARGAAFGVSITIAGPWYWLANIVYQQARAWVTDQFTYPTLPYPVTNADGTTNELTPDQEAANYAVVSDPSNYPNEVKMTSALLLNQLDTGTTCSTDVFITQVLNYAISKGAPFQVGTIDPGITVPLEEVRDQMCSEVIRRLLQWTPDQVPWFDYTTTPPTLNFEARANRLALNITAPNDCPTTIKLKARRDLLVPGVTINYITAQQRSGLTFYTLQQDIAGQPDGLFALSATLELMGGSVIDQAGTVFAAGEPAPTGLAAALLDGYGFLHYEGSVEVVAQDCPGGNYLSRVLNVLGANPAWAAMKAFIQRQTDTVFDGHTVIDVGPPSHLSPSDLLARLRALRGFHSVTDLGSSRMSGSAPAPTNPAPAQPLYSGPVSSNGPDDDELPDGSYDSIPIAAAFTVIRRNSGTNDFRKDYPPESVDTFAARGLAPELIDVASFPTVTASIELSASLFAKSFVGYGILSIAVYGYDVRHAEGWQTTATLNLTGFGIAPNSRIYLVGTKTLSTADGSSATTPASRDISAYGGNPAASFKVTATYGATIVNNTDSLVGGKSLARSGSVTFTEMRVYPPKPL